MWVKGEAQELESAVTCGQDSGSLGLTRRLAVMSPRLPLDVPSTGALDAWDTDVLRGSVVELLVAAGSYCKRRNSDKVRTVALRTELESMKYMTGSRQLLRAENRSMISLVRSMMPPRLTADVAQLRSHIEASEGVIRHEADSEEERNHEGFPRSACVACSVRQVGFVS